MTNEEFDKAVWRKGDKVIANEVEMEVAIICLEDRFIVAECGHILDCDDFERVEDHKLIEQLPEEKVHQIINRSMWDNDCPNPEQKQTEL